MATHLCNDNLNGQLFTPLALLDLEFNMKMTPGVFNFDPVSLRPSGIMYVFMTYISGFQ